jgi:peroxiredoxin
MSQRANIIVGEDGTVKWVKVYPISQLPDIQEVLQALSEI